MVRRSGLFILFFLAASLLAAVPALAGGWAVITLDSLPENLTPGQPITIGFTVRQHGYHLMEGLDPVITLSHPGTGERLSIPAVPGDRPGHYLATLNLPSEERWEWSIQAFTKNQEMPPLTIGPASQASPPAPGMARTLSGTAIALGMVLTLAALAILFRQRSRWALALVVTGLLVSSFGFLSATAGSSRPKPPGVPAVLLEEKGQQLFIAKGCITCHRHDKISRDRDTIYVDIGPNLTQFTADPAYLRDWLQDPASIKPETLMPDLELEDDEIEALVAFLNAK